MHKWDHSNGVVTFWRHPIHYKSNGHLLSNGHVFVVAEMLWMDGRVDKTTLLSFQSNPIQWLAMGRASRLTFRRRVRHPLTSLTACLSFLCPFHLHLKGGWTDDCESFVPLSLASTLEIRARRFHFVNFVWNISFHADPQKVSL